MKNNRLNYFILILLVMILGIISRKISNIPLFIGDVLYAVLIYLGLRFLFIHLKMYKTFLLGGKENFYFGDHYSIRMGEASNKKYYTKKMNKIFI